MIFCIIFKLQSKNAEELEEREKHRNLEKNYNFNIEDNENDVDLNAIEENGEGD